jgi:alpha-beta hydrolase superfamily lysophospholipase
MLEAIDARELIVLNSSPTRIQGTYHRPAHGPEDSAFASADQGRVGVLFINSLSLPRAASGDSAVHWADRIAERGVPAFRVDLPGLGDSAGEASTDLLDNINAGVFASVAAAIMKELADRYELSGLILFGHCAGSVSAIYTAGVSKECRGLILLDPYFHLPQAKRPRVREELSDWARRSRVGRMLSNIFDRLKKVRLAASGSGLPANANSDLLAQWKQVATAGLPILLLRSPGIKAQGDKPRVGEFDYIDHVLKLAGRRSRVLAEFVDGADHSFANRVGRQAVDEHIEHWVELHFGLQEASRSAQGVAASRAGNNQNESRKPSGKRADLGVALEGR